MCPKSIKVSGFVGNEIKKKLNNTVSFAVDKRTMEPLLHGR
jgi:hypothetical protein